MKSAVRCGFLLIGVPNLAGFLIATGIGVLLSGLFRAGRSTLILGMLDLVSGIAGVFAGIILTRWIGLQPAMWLPMIACVWFAIHFGLSGAMLQFVLSSGGVMVGWLAYILAAQ